MFCKSVQVPENKFMQNLLSLSSLSLIFCSILYSYPHPLKLSKTSLKSPLSHDCSILACLKSPNVQNFKQVSCFYLLVPWQQPSPTKDPFELTWTLQRAMGSDLKFGRKFNFFQLFRQLLQYWYLLTPLDPSNQALCNEQ